MVRLLIFLIIVGAIVFFFRAASKPSKPAQALPPGSVA
jgi:uncharacterized protein YpmB